MKAVCLIISVIVILLSSAPCCLDDKCSEEVMQTQSNHQHDNNDECGHCSPFLTCGTCTGFVAKHAFVNLQPLLPFVEKKHKFHIYSFINNFYSEFWQPPKIS